MADDDARLQAWTRLLDDLAAEAAALRAQDGPPDAERTPRSDKVSRHQLTLPAYIGDAAADRG